MLTGFAAVDIPSEFLQEYHDAVMRRLWREAAEHHDGGGMEGGVCNYSYRALLR